MREKSDNAKFFSGSIIKTGRETTFISRNTFPAPQLISLTVDQSSHENVRASLARAL